jgi:hypothetical protein
LLDFLDASIMKGDRNELPAVGYFFLRIELLLFLFQILTAENTRLTIFVYLGEFHREKNIVNLLKSSWILNFFFERHEAETTIDTYETNVPGVSRPSNLCLKAACILSSNND